MAQIQETLRHPKLFQTLDDKPPCDVLLCGPPGSSKTLITCAVINKTGALFFLVYETEMTNMVGKYESPLHKAFEKTAKNETVIILIEEIKYIAPKREKTNGKVSKKLPLMNGLMQRASIVVIGAMHRLKSIDLALSHFGRFDREFEIGMSEGHSCLAIFRKHLRNMKFDTDVHTNAITRVMHGFMNADIVPFGKRNEEQTDNIAYDNAKNAYRKVSSSAHDLLTADIAALSAVAAIQYICETIDLIDIDVGLMSL